MVWLRNFQLRNQHVEAWAGFHRHFLLHVVLMAFPWIQRSLIRSPKVRVHGRSAVVPSFTWQHRPDTTLGVNLLSREGKSQTGFIPLIVWLVLWKVLSVGRSCPFFFHEADGKALTLKHFPDSISRAPYVGSIKEKVSCGWADKVMLVPRRLCCQPSGLSLCGQFSMEMNGHNIKIRSKISLDSQFNFLFQCWES